MIGKLRRGERNISVMQLLTLVAVACSLAVGYFLIHSYRTRWEHAQRITVQICESRNNQTKKLQTLEKADIELQQGLITIEQHNRFVDQVTRSARVALFTRKLNTDEEFLTITMPNCQTLNP